MKKFIQSICALILFALFTMGIAAPVHAADQTTSLRISFKAESGTIAVPGAELSVYKLAEPGDTDGSLRWYEDYADDAFAPFDLSDQEMVAKAAELAKAFTARSGLKPLRTLVTDAGGVAAAEADDGLYLICGKDTKLDGRTYSITPFLLLLPQTDSAGDRLEALDVELKYTVDEPGQPGKTPTPTTPSTPNKTQTPSSGSSSQNVSTPGTGDGIGLWIAACILSACGLLFVTARRKRKEGGYE